MSNSDPHRLGLVSTRVHCFQLVGRLGSIRQAARAINVAPSSISRVIAQLEEELGTPLFERQRQRLKLTSAGELLLYHTRAATAELVRAVTEINDLHGLRRGHVTVAVIESVARGFLPRVLEAFWLRHPEITVDVRVANSQEASDAIRDGEADVAIAFDPRPPRTARKLAAIALPIGAVTPKESRIAARTELRLSDLAGERIVTSDASLALSSSLEEALGSGATDFTRRSRTNSIAVMVDMVRQGLCVALITRIGIERELASGELAFVPLRDPKLPVRRLTLLARARGEMSDAANALATLLTRSLDEIGR